MDIEQTQYIGCCQHNIPAEWYNSDESTYTILDTVSGAYVLVTTCQECKADAQASGTIVTEVPLDDFYVAEPFVGSKIVTVNEAGEVEIQNVDTDFQLTDDEINLALDIEE